MSNVNYDLDTSGGLMPLIQALIKPPDEEPNGTKTKKPQHPYYKRPGKGHNHDSCDACGEGGDLLCCDRCPASFHLGCYDPPLEVTDIPSGQWLCKQCCAADVEKAPSSRGSRAQSPDEPKPEERKTRSLRNSKKNLPAPAPAKDKIKDTTEVDEVASEKSEEKEPSPMEILVRAAKIMNPTQFELPREIRVPCPFPGTEKETNSNSKNGNGNVVNVDAWGCVPLPAKHCFVCQGTCKSAPLIQCDYCPLLFHQDCLDPPLTALPTGRWMCPNHVEQIIDWKLVNSISATERVALWDRYTGPVDQHAIKIDFIRQARKANPSFRVKIPVGIQGRVIVPEMVKYHYRNPPPLMPSRREYVRCKNVMKQLKLSAGYESEEETDSKKKRKICMNIKCPKYTGEGICPHEEPELTELKEASAKDAADDLRAIEKPLDELKSFMETDSSEESDPDDDKLSLPKKRKLSQDDEKSSKKKEEPEQRLELRVEGNDAEELLAMAEEQLNKLDERLVKLLAWQRLQQVLVGERCVGPWRRAPLSARAEELVVRSIDRNQLTRYGFKHIALPSELLSREDHERIARTIWGTPTENSNQSPPLSPGHSLSDATVRATLCPVERPASKGLGDGFGHPIAMRLSRLSIGKDSHCDVCLPPTCRYISNQHALIFYDDITRHFEIMNYSEWGTRVNGVLYTCDIDQALPPPQEVDDAESKADAVREIAKRRMPHTPRINGDLTKGDPHQNCQCGTISRDTKGAWEGSALLQHGSLLQFGCHMFVFSITDGPGFPYYLQNEDEE